jgi:hypothetical protein
MCNKLKNQTLYIVLVTFLELELPRPAGTTILVVNPILDLDWVGWVGALYPGQFYFLSLSKATCARFWAHARTCMLRLG